MTEVSSTVRKRAKPSKAHPSTPGKPLDVGTAAGTPKSTVAAKKSTRSRPAAKTASQVEAAPQPMPTAVKSKLVRDSFTIPKPEYDALAELKRRALTLGVAVKKSELLRAGIAALVSMSDSSFKSAVEAVPNLKTGRPKIAKDK